MKSTFTNSSRRNFLERLAIASTVLVASPTFLLAQNYKHILRFALLGEDSSIADVIDKSDTMSLVDDYTLADVIYLNKTYKHSQTYIQGILASGKHLIIEDNGDRNSLIEDCKKSGNLLTIVERSTDASKLFENANFYECYNSKTVDFQKIITTLLFLEQNTKPIKFKIKTEQNPVEISVS